MTEVLGQVFTPPAVADLALALALERSGPRARLLDPACGDGVFLARAAARGVPAGCLEGIEIDPRAAAAARAHVPGAGVRTGDFFAEPPAPVYDAVVGNPPYVRQELLGAERKRELAEWRLGRADLAVAFFARALRFLAPGGRLAFVLSAAALDAGAAALQAALALGGARALAVVASPRERWFRAAAVHALIIVVEKGGPPGPVRLARLRLPVARAAARVRGLRDLTAVAAVRAGAPDRVAEWGPLLRAPDAWLAAREAAGPWLVPLGELAEVQRGLTSGANSFYYLSRARAAELRLERRLLAPLFKTPRQAQAISVDAGALPTLAFVCPPDALAACPNARAYVRAHAHLARRPTLAGRPSWWSLAARPARLFLGKAYSARFVQHVTSAPVVADQRVYAVRPRRGVTLLAAVLNGTLSALALESLGRASMGEGALEHSVGDALRLPVLDARRLAAPPVVAAFRRLARRPIGDVFAEAAARDREALDRALLPPRLRRLLPELREALLVTVEERLARARI